MDRRHLVAQRAVDRHVGVCELDEVDRRGDVPALDRRRCFCGHPDPVFHPRSADAVCHHGPRALILRGVWKDNKPTAASTSYNRVSTPKVEKVSGNVGHLYFASGFSTQNEDADHTGRYGFRCVKDVEKVRELLSGAIGKHA